MASDDNRPPAMTATGLHKTFGSGDGAVTAVDDVSMRIDHGEIVGLLGPNGAGKTTTIKCLLGLVVPDSGTVEVCGVDVLERPERAHAHVTSSPAVNGGASTTGGMPAAMLD